jgi:hypothetical protein
MGMKKSKTFHNLAGMADMATSMRKTTKAVYPTNPDEHSKVPMLNTKPCDAMYSPRSVQHSLDIDPVHISALPSALAMLTISSPRKRSSSCPDSCCIETQISDDDDNDDRNKKRHADSCNTKPVTPLLTTPSEDDADVWFLMEFTSPAKAL